MVVLIAKARRRKARRGAAPLSDQARAPGFEHQQSPEGGDIYQPRVERPIGSGALGRIRAHKAPARFLPRSAQKA